MKKTKRLWALLLAVVMAFGAYQHSVRGADH